MNRKIKAIPVTICLLLWQLMYLTACQKAENIKISAAKPEVEIFAASIDPQSGARSVRNKVVHLVKDTVYLLNEIFVRDAGEQLIIDEGTLIKVKTSGTVGGITINPGGLITATGSPNKPIVFTSNQREATQGANWEGIVIRGKSFNNARGTTGTGDDFSGVLKYVRVEFAPLVLDGVGSQTVLENVMVSYTNRAVFEQYQSAFTIQGGTFNARNLIAYACAGPSDFFITNGYTGKMQNIIACRHPYFGKTGDNPENSLSGIFIQNNSNNPLGAKPFTHPVISNLTVVGPNGANGSPAAYADTNFRSGALVTTNNAYFHIRNSVFLGYPVNGWYLNDEPVAKLLEGRKLVDFNYSMVHCNTPSRIFYLVPGTDSTYTSEDFRRYMTSGEFFKNQASSNAADLNIRNIRDFDNGPDLLPNENSPLLKGANFENSDFFNNSFFNKNITYIGAMGTDDWTRGWSNFTPLKTNYNFPN